MADAKNLRFSNGKAGSAIHITALTAGEGAGIMTRGKGTVAIDHDIVIDKVEGSRMAAGVKTTNPGDTISLKSLKIDPVSYTHLDVYKRQGLIRTQQQLPAPGRH